MCFFLLFRYEQLDRITYPQETDYFFLLAFNKAKLQSASICHNVEILSVGQIFKWRDNVSSQTTSGQTLEMLDLSHISTRIVQKHGSSYLKHNEMRNKPLFN
jgi:hypothetical protein